MAINVQRKLSELQAQCNKLGLKVTQSGKRESKTDYILALREYYIGQLYPNGLPKDLELMLEMESPMLCSRFTEFSPEEKERLWNSPNYIIEQKEDGARLVNFFIDGRWGCYSRNISVKDFLPVNYSSKMCQDGIDLTKLRDQFVVDSEIVSSNPNVCTIVGNKGVVCETQLQAVTALLAMNEEDSIRIQKEENCPLELRVFDVIWWNGEWIKDKPLIERVPYIVEAVKQLQEAGVKCRRPYSSYSNKKAFYKAMLAMGAEGGVLKNLYSPYIDTSSRRKDGFIKVKRTMSEAMQDSGIGDGIDAFVTGFEPADEDKSWAGYVGALEFSVYLRGNDGSVKTHKIARITNITMELRKELTVMDENGNPTLSKDWYGRVATVDGQCLSARAMRLKHARLIEWRPDRSEDTCILDEDYAKSMVL